MKSPSATPPLAEPEVVGQPSVDPTDSIVLRDSSYTEALFDAATGRDTLQARAATRLLAALPALAEAIPRGLCAAARTWDAPRSTASRDSARFKMAVEARGEGRRVVLDVTYRHNSLIIRFEPRERVFVASIVGIGAGVPAALYMIESLPAHLEALVAPPEDEAASAIALDAPSAANLTVEPEFTTC